MTISVPPGETAVVAALLFCIFYLKFVESRYAGSAIWLSWEYDPGFFCEGLADHAVNFLREPINTYSCFSYIAVGLWVLLCAARHVRDSEADLPKALFLHMTYLSRKPLGRRPWQHSALT
jgi:hypothetical protein